MTKISTAIAFFVLTFLVVSTMEQPQPAEKADQRAEAPTYNPDDYWVFKVTRFSKEQSSADEIQKGGEFVLVPTPKRARVFRLTDGNRIPITRPGNLSMMLPTVGVQQEIAKYYDFPLFVGKKWEAPGFQNKLTSPKNEVTAIETVTTPAGSFPVYKIERLISRTMLDGNVQRFWFTYYYSPQTRSLVKFNYENNTLICGVRETI